MCMHVCVGAWEARNARELSREGVVERQAVGGQIYSARRASALAENPWRRGCSLVWVALKLGLNHKYSNCSIAHAATDENRSRWQKNKEWRQGVWCCVRDTVCKVSLCQLKEERRSNFAIWNCWWVYSCSQIYLEHSKGFQTCPCHLSYYFCYVHSTETLNKHCGAGRDIKNNTSF